MLQSDVSRETLRRFTPVGHCIFCGSADHVLTDEHIIPLALNGNLILPEASCHACADITKKFEQTVARLIYGPFRLKHGFRTRRKKDRPSTLPVYSLDNQGNEKKIEISLNQYPNIYLTVDAPPPGILIGNAPSNRNPELTLGLRGDPIDLKRSMDSLSIDQIITRHKFEWGAFFQQLAKIGHTFAYAIMRGKCYDPFLPDIILGKSLHLSHYVGGVNQETKREQGTTNDLTLSVVCRPSGDYLVAGVQLLGAGVLPPYQVVVGQIPNLEAFVTEFVEARNLV